MASVACDFSHHTQHLQSAGPLNYKLTSGLRKLHHEATVIAELLNIAADPTAPPKLEHSELLSYILFSFFVCTLVNVRFTTS